MVDAAPQKEEIKADVETPYVRFWKEGDIICAAYADKIHITLDIAKHVVEERLKYCGNKSYLCYVDARGLRSATREAREYLADEGSACVIKGAIHIDSIVTRTLGNIFLSVNKPKASIKLFTSKEEAKAWLNNPNNT